MPQARHEARRLAMQALCQWEVQGDEADAVLADFLTDRQAPQDARHYATMLFKQYLKEREQVDCHIQTAADRWQLSRISPVERNIMRIAVAEWTAGGVPPKVVLNEAIDLGHEFGGKDSPRFINGILDRILKLMTEGKEQES